MDAIGNTAATRSSEPQRVEDMRTHTSTPSDAARDVLVVDSVHTDAELAVIAEDLALIKVLEHQLKEGIAAHEKARLDGASPAQLQELENQMGDLLAKADTLKRHVPVRAAAFWQLRELKTQRLDLHRQLSVKGLSQREIDHTVRKIGNLERQLERAQFHADGGGSATEFVRYQARNRRMEIAACESRLAAGGLNRADAHSLRSRIRDAEASLADLASWLATNDPTRPQDSHA